MAAGHNRLRSIGSRGSSGAFISLLDSTGFSNAGNSRQFGIRFGDEMQDSGQELPCSRTQSTLVVVVLLLLS